jgi:MoaA/NifB/PqqE/SkfB family radical SAM enzyme
MKYLLSPWIKYRREGFGCTVLNLQSKEIQFLNRTSAYILEGFFEENHIDSAYFDGIPGCTQFIQKAINDGVVSPSRNSKVTSACLFNIEVLDFPETHLHLPLGIEIELTRRCLRKCSYCAYDSHPKFDTTGELTSDEWIGVLTEASQTGVLMVRFTGGDPLVRKDTMRILVATDRLGMLITLGTDLTSMTDGIAEELAKLDNFHILQTSLDGPDKKNADRYRGNGCFRHVLRGIEVLNEYSVPFMVGMVVTNENKHLLTDTANFAQGLGARHFVYSPIYESGRAQEIDSIELDNEELENVAKEYQKWLLESSGRQYGSLDEEFVVYTPKLIRAADRYIRIDPLGNCYPSIQVYNAAGTDCIVGSVRTMSLLKIWSESQILTKMREINTEKSIGGKLISLSSLIERISQDDKKEIEIGQV